MKNSRVNSGLGSPQDSVIAWRAGGGEEDQDSVIAWSIWTITGQPEELPSI